MRVLRDGIIQIILNHQHDRCGLFAVGRVIVNGTGHNFMDWAKTVHINSSIGIEFVFEFFNKNCMLFFIKITQGIF